ncbi:hypothetical protein LBBP_00457 [Leptospira borgpetersenii serovar Ballum]|uniref:Uncharacterized protein n=1 Tax=Leptospira borgpetersenii serovar Ballum TaxID=280505 RepID=A0A0S2IMH7_LEPBO|nr:hypothetical protein LBBP_00457 [Leptospira borgpetersenii serovar Ballum]
MKNASSETGVKKKREKNHGLTLKKNILGQFRIGLKFASSKN